jgi:hypothetical protein
MSGSGQGTWFSALPGPLLFQTGYLEQISVDADTDAARVDMHLGDTFLLQSHGLLHVNILVGSPRARNGDMQLTKRHHKAIIGCLFELAGQIAS